MYGSIPNAVETASGPSDEMESTVNLALNSDFFRLEAIRTAECLIPWHLYIKIHTSIY